MAVRSLKMINAKLQFLYRQNESLNPKLRRLLYNSLIQQYIDYVCISCVRFCLKRNSRHYIGAKEFNEIKWPPTKQRVEQRVATSVFKYWIGNSPFYVNELFVPSRNIFKARSHMALEIPLRKNSFPAGIYLFKVNNRNTRTRCEICLKLTIKTPERHPKLTIKTLERRQWRRSGLFIFTPCSTHMFTPYFTPCSSVSIVNFEQLGQVKRAFHLWGYLFGINRAMT